MFNRIQLEEWHAMLKSVGFMLFLIVFTFMLLRAIFMRRRDVDHASSLPLENEKFKETHGNLK